jgi:hypothetical protein
MARTNIPPHFVAEIEAVNKALDDPAFTAVAFARSITKQIADMQFAPERIATIRSQLQEFERQVRTFGNDDAVALRQAALRLFSAARALAQPILPLQPAHIVRQIFEPLQQVGWASATLELLASDLKVGEKILSFDADGITTDLRRIDRLQLIDRMRPMSWTNIDSWRKEHVRSKALYSGARVEQ